MRLKESVAAYSYTYIMHGYVLLFQILKIWSILGILLLKTDHYFRSYVSIYNPFIIHLFFICTTSFITIYLTLFSCLTL